MALGRRRKIHQDNTWPGFVDALATLLMVIIFLLMIFVVAQIFLSATLSGSEKKVENLNSDLSELTELLNLERAENAGLRDNVSNLSTELQSTLALNSQLETAIHDFETENARIREDLADAFKTVEADKETIELKLAEIAKLQKDAQALSALRDELTKQIQQQASKIDQAEGKLIEERELSESQRAQNALLNQQLLALRQQLASIQQSLESSEALNESQKVEIRSLGQRLNAALATKVQELSKYRSQFFGELRKVLGNKSGVRIVGDRFVFQSEVLFNSGEATLGAAGIEQINSLAKTLLEISGQIPSDINWILRVDGHTDNIPISTTKFASNWELSTQRAISVVKALIAQGIAPNRLAAAGFGEFQPLDDRNDEIARRRNRRIEIKLTQ